ncbi:hypothetical protein LCGC14_0951110 [marine sediment metagenome]|uniref:Uncharacterized protein n=1 Tax=marine sediment metagenome TaxID=412755 RepID=A0A0F9R0Q3_9ZZZZ
MAIKLPDGRYKCSFCLKIYKKPLLADKCREGHDIVYIQLLRSDLNRLLQFIYLKDDELLTETLMTTLRKYKRM